MSDPTARPWRSPRRRSPGVLSTAAAALALWLLCLCSGCAADTDFGGIWHGIAPTQGPANDLLYGPNGEPLALELVLGEYGPDLAGLLRFYKQGSFVRARDANPPDSECACSLLYGGRSAGGVAAFALRGCLPGAATKVEVRTRATLSRDDLGVLQLKLVVDEPTSAHHAKAVVVTLLPQASASEVSDADLLCPVGPTAGNPASGQ